MNSDELIGKAAAEYIRLQLSEDDSAGVARYLLDCLTADQTAAIAKAILANASLSVHRVAGDHRLHPDRMVPSDDDLTDFDLTSLPTPVAEGVRAKRNVSH